MTDFTIVLPTTNDRAATLEPVLRHVQLQSVTDWELFIIGDGVNEETRQTIEYWCRNDSRMHFFDHPKDTRRGEIYRHQALKSAQGRNVAYLCDRDLWLYDHLETLGRTLDTFDFAHTQSLVIDPAGNSFYHPDIDLKSDYQRNNFRPSGRSIALSTVGHTIASYQRLPFGWRTTPKDCKTDRYMWLQFLDEQHCTARSAAWPTVLYFSRGDHPGWPSAARAEELVRWNQHVPDVETQRRFREEAMQVLPTPLHRARQVWRSWLLWHPRMLAVYQRFRRGFR